MQEKIQPPPPSEIKIFEGKLPPTSWVNENIVKYLHIKSEVDFLTNFLHYTQELQAQKLVQSRSGPSTLREAFAPFPDEGSSEEVRTTSLFNSIQGYVKIEFEYLEKFMLLIRQASPMLSAQLEQKLADLKRMARNFPKLSGQELQHMGNLVAELTEMSKRLPVGYKKAFWAEMLKMLHTMMSENGSNIKEFQNEVKELQGRTKLLQNLQELLDEIQSTLQSKAPNAAQFLKSLETLQNLANSNTFLTTEQNQALVTLFQQLNQFKNSQGQSLKQIAADSLIQNKMSEFLKAKPSASIAEILQHLSHFLKESNLQSSHLPFMQSLGDTIEDVLNQKGFPATQGETGLSFAKVTAEKIISNDESIDRLLSNYSPDPKSIAKLQDSLDNLRSLFSQEISGNAAKIDGFQSTLVQLKNIQNQLGKSALWSTAQSLAVGKTPPGAEEAGGPTLGAGGTGVFAPLPAEFAHAILGHYMPGQEAYLESLAMFLFIDNTGAEFGNTLLTKMMDFGEAADNYDFNNFLHSSDHGNFSGMGYSAAKNQINNEKRQCSNDINSAKSAINSINSQINQINNYLSNPNLTASQRSMYTKMKDSLEAEQGELNVVIGQLQDLQKLLSHLHVNPPKGKMSSSKYFSVSYSGPPLPPPFKAGDWHSALDQYEGNVVNGDPGNLKKDPPEPAGGLVNVQAQAQNFQQYYSDQGQNMQMVLQMRMTEIQQEWTLVSSALQELNQMYMTLDQALYK